jgi:glycosyltransferase involved in cell wall biosynthesis
MKILFGITHSEPGGATILWHDLGTAFKARGHEVAMVALYPHGDNDDTSMWRYCLDHPPSGAQDVLRAIWKAKQLCQSISADAIFTALPAANVIFPMASLITKRRRPMNFISQHTPSETYNQKFNYLDGLLGTSPVIDGVICVSNAVRESLAGKSKAYQRKTHVIKNALPPSIEIAVAKLCEDHVVVNGGRRIIASGRLAAQKNLSVLIKAMAQVKDATLEIVGAGPEEMLLKSLALEVGIFDRIIFAGWKSREEALRCVAMSNVFVQPSRFEGHSLALVEAAKLGIPIIVSDVPSQVEGITRSDGRQCAISVDPDDHCALATAISSVLDNPDQRTLYRSLSLSLASEITFSGMVDQYEACLPKERLYASP